MSQTGKKNLVITSIALYFTYFIHGIGASIMGQYKPELAAHWGAKALSDGTMDVSMVVSVIAALGLGRLISLPFSGPLSDKFGRRLSGIIGVICYAAYFMGIAFAPSMGVAYAFAIVGGIANSFLDTCVSPTCMEIYVNNPSVANLFTKFSMCISQFLLPFLIGFVAAANMSYRTIFIVAGAAIFIDGILILFLPFPNRNTAGTVKKEKAKLKITPAALAAILIGFTSSSTFMLWLNCNQELGKLYNLSDPSKIQSFYAVGTFAAILCSSVFIKKGQIDVAFLRTLGVDFMPKIIRSFLNANKGKQIHFNLFCDKVLTGDILTGLKEKKYDIGFCSKFDDEPLIEFIPVAKQDLVVIVPPEHPLAEKSEIHLEETLPYKQIIFKKRSGLRQIIDQLFKSIGQYPDVAFEIDEDQVAAGFVANDFGICIAPDIPILHSLNLKILPLVSPSWQRNFYMAMLKDVYHPPVVEAFKKFVIEETSREIFYKTN